MKPVSINEERRMWHKARNTSPLMTLNKLIHTDHEGFLVARPITPEMPLIALLPLQTSCGNACSCMPPCPRDAPYMTVLWQTWRGRARQLAPAVAASWSGPARRVRTHWLGGNAGSSGLPASWLLSRQKNRARPFTPFNHRGHRGHGEL